MHSVAFVFYFWFVFLYVFLCLNSFCYFYSTSYYSVGLFTSFIFAPPTLPFIVFNSWIGLSSFSLPFFPFSPISPSYFRPYSTPSSLRQKDSLSPLLSISSFPQTFLRWLALSLPLDLAQPTTPVFRQTPPHVTLFIRTLFRLFELVFAGVASLLASARVYLSVGFSVVCCLFADFRDSIRKSHYHSNLVLPYGMNECYASYIPMPRMFSLNINKFCSFHWLTQICNSMCCK